MNSILKKSHGTTPFRVMWGRDSRYEDLIPYINEVSVSAEDDIYTEEAIFALYDTQDDEYNPEDLYSPPLDQSQESIAALDEFRETTSKLSIEYIGTEQLKQKRQYDKSHTRKVCQHTCFIVMSLETSNIR